MAKAKIKPEETKEEEKPTKVTKLSGRKLEGKEYDEWRRGLDEIVECIDALKKEKKRGK